MINKLLLCLALLLTACASRQEEAFPYPRLVVEANEQQHYKTALWCAYTSYLDSIVFRMQPIGDSARSTLQELVSLDRRLTAIEKGSGTTCFRFHIVGPDATVLRLYGNCHKYGPNPEGFKLLVAVWINNKDGLVDSILDINNIYYLPALKEVEGQRLSMAPAYKRTLWPNVNQPCKAAFLQANHPRLANDLRRLLREKQETLR